MNPRVAAAAARVGFDAADYTWFDFFDLDESATEELQAVARQHGWDRQMLHLNEFPVPAERMVIIQPDWSEAVFTYDRAVKIGMYEGAAVMLWGLDGEEVPLFIVTEKAVRTKNDGLPEGSPGRHGVMHYRLREALLKQGKNIDEMIDMFEQTCISAVNYTCLVNLRAHTTEQVVEAYTAKGMEFINRKRRAKREAPIYTWNTIELKPQPIRVREDKGGTHASPARHKRRAHMRRLRTGGFTWVAEAWVGKIENGLVVHDYVPDRELTKEGEKV